jgi:hypothetical protein
MTISVVDVDVYEQTRPHAEPFFAVRTLDVFVSVMVADVIGVLIESIKLLSTSSTNLRLVLEAHVAAQLIIAFKV